MANCSALDFALCICSGAIGSSGLIRTATLEAAGAISFRIDNLLPASSAAILVTPVILPPGRERLLIKATPTGSATLTITIGTVEVAAFAAKLPGVVETNRRSG